MQQKETFANTLAPKTLIAQYLANDAELMKRAVCEAVGTCAKRDIKSYEAAIALAAGCVEHHFGLDPKKIGVPLVTQAVVGIQVLQTLAGGMDFEDSETWRQHNVDAFNAALDLADVFPGDEASRNDLWAFVSGQAIAVLRGEFDNRQ